MNRNFWASFIVWLGVALIFLALMVLAFWARHLCHTWVAPVLMGLTDQTAIVLACRP
jgi:hypothetical protein